VRVCAETSVAIAALMITGWMPGRIPKLLGKVEKNKAPFPRLAFDCGLSV
jgi:hypothetical protein